MPVPRNSSPEWQVGLQPNLARPILFSLTKRGTTMRAEVEITVEEAREFSQALAEAADRAESHMPALQTFFADLEKMAPKPPPAPPQPAPQQTVHTGPGQYGNDTVVPPPQASQQFPNIMDMEIEVVSANGKPS